MKGFPRGKITKIWWVHGLRGLFAILYGLFALFCPEHALTILILLFGVFALIDGIFALWTALHGSSNKELLRTALAEGVTGIIVGAVVLIAPHITEIVLIYLITIWAGLTGLLQIFAVDKQNRVTFNDWQFVLAGILSVLFGGFLLLFPKEGMLVLIWCLSGYMLAFGVLVLNLAWRLYKHEHHRPSPHSPLHFANRG